MAIESELAQRQAELDSLAQQQAYLKDQTSMATVKVNIERLPDPKAAVAKDDDSGFLAGLAAGWDGLKTTVVAVATVVGALLPFAVLVLPGRRPGLAAGPSDAQVTGHRSESCARRSALTLPGAHDRQETGIDCTYRVSASS